VLEPRRFSSAIETSRARMRTRTSSPMSAFIPGATSSPPEKRALSMGAAHETEKIVR
jgi:hypothetical protein